MVTDIAFFVAFIFAFAMLVGYASFRQWLSHRRRQMVHAERMAAIEKGLPVPPLEAEVKRGGWGVQRLLLLLGLLWISAGLGYALVVKVLMSDPSTHFARGTPKGVEWFGVAPVLIGLSHLIVYLVGKKREDAENARLPQPQSPS